MSAAVSALVREAGPLLSPSPGVQVASSVSKVLSNVRAAVSVRKVSFVTQWVTFCAFLVDITNCVRAGAFLRHSLALIMNDADQLAGWGELV